MKELRFIMWGTLLKYCCAACGIDFIIFMFPENDRSVRLPLCFYEAIIWIYVA